MATSKFDRYLSSLQPINSDGGRVTKDHKAKKKLRRARLAARERIDMPTRKRCSKCQEVNLAEGFSKSRTEKDGLKAECKICAKAQRADWYQRNRDREIAKANEWNKAHPEQAAAANKKALAKGRIKFNATRLAVYHQNRDEISAARKRRYKTDDVYRNDKLSRATARYRSRDPEEVRAYTASYRAQNRAAINFLSAKYRVLKKNAGVGIAITEWLDILEYFDHRCAYCMGRDVDVGSLEMEHMIPLSRGGKHIASNIVPSCLACNRSKSDATPLEFISHCSIGGSVKPMRHQKPFMPVIPK